MEAKKEKISDIKNLDELVNNSVNGTAFAYTFFLKLKKVKHILTIYDNKEIIALMPLFEDNKSLNQSTMYIPYGGPIILYNFKTYRKQILYTREVLNVISKFLIANYDSISFSMDPSLIDIKTLVNNGLIPEVRYTYRIDLDDSIDTIYNRFGRDRKRDIKREKNVSISYDDNLNIFDFEKALIWEYNYAKNISKDFTKMFLKESILNNKGKIFVASKDSKILGAVAIVWDIHSAYIMYSYYDKNIKSVIPILYYEIIKYLKDNNICKYLDFEGSVFKEIEEWNLSFGAKQTLYFNFYYEKDNMNQLYEELYDFGEKNEKYI